MNKRRFKKAVKRLSHLPGGKYFLMYSGNKVKQILYKLFRSTKVAYPSTVMLELSSHCNLHCTTCPREYDYGKAFYKGYMPLDKAKKIIDEIWPYLDSIGLTGMGETLLYKDLVEVVDYIKSKNSGIIVSLSTNAMIPDFIEKIRPLAGKVDTIQVSIDGLDDVYESIRVNASFSVLDHNLQQLKPIFSPTQTTLMLNMVVTKGNYMQMADMVGYAEKTGIHYMNFTLFNLAAVTGIASNYYDFYQTPEFIAALKALNERKLSAPGVEVTNWDFHSKSGFRKCGLPWSHFQITASGDIPPCCAKPFPAVKNFGNLFESGILPVLNGKSFRSFRKMWYANQAPSFCEKCHFTDIEPIKY